MYPRLIPLVWLAILSVAMAYEGEGDVTRVGDTAPIISGVATDGSTVSLESYKGKVILLGFFATWCGGCVAEMPRLEREVHQVNKDAGLVVIEVGRGHSYQELARFKANRGFSFTILADPRRELYTRYATDYVPRCYLIGKDGKVKYASTGINERDFAELKRHVAEELAVMPGKIEKSEKVATPQRQDDEGTR